MRGARGEGFFEAVERGQDAAHHADGVAALRGKAAVRGAALREDLEPGVAFVGDDEIEAGGLQNNGGIGGKFSEQRFGADAVALLVHDGGKKQRTRKHGPLADERNRRGAHGGNTALDVQRAASEEGAAALDRRERAGHVAGADGINVRARRGGSCGRRAEKRDDVGSAARSLVQLGVNSVAAEKVAQECGG